ncbi:unnamed protein product [Cochlearia groenlandica]
MCRSIFPFFTSMIAPAVPKKGLPKMSGSLGSLSISRTTKSVGMKAFPSLTGMSSKSDLVYLVVQNFQVRVDKVELSVEIVVGVIHLCMYLFHECVEVHCIAVLTIQDLLQ